MGAYIFLNHLMFSIQGEDTFSRKHKAIYLLLDSSRKGIASTLGTCLLLLGIIHTTVLLFTMEIEEAPWSNVNMNIH